MLLNEVKSNSTCEAFWISLLHKIIDPCLSSQSVAGPLLSKLNSDRSYQIQATFLQVSVKATYSASVIESITLFDSDIFKTQV